MVVDSGFAIPEGVDVIDISLSANRPMVLEVMAELIKFFSVEKLIMANQTKSVSPAQFKNISVVFGHEVMIEL